VSALDGAGTVVFWLFDVSGASVGLSASASELSKQAVNTIAMVRRFINVSPIPRWTSLSSAACPCWRICTLVLLTVVMKIYSVAGWFGLLGFVAATNPSRGAPGCLGNEMTVNFSGQECPLYRFTPLRMPPT
jgi:hypothetical protein